MLGSKRQNKIIMITNKSKQISAKLSVSTSEFAALIQSACNIKSLKTTRSIQTKFSRQLAKSLLGYSQLITKPEKPGY